MKNSITPQFIAVQNTANELTLAERRKLTRVALDETLLSANQAFKTFRTLFVRKETQVQAVNFLNDLIGIADCVKIDSKGNVTFPSNIQGLNTLFVVMAGQGLHLTAMLEKMDSERKKKAFTPSQMLTMAYRFAKYAESVKGKEWMLNRSLEHKRKEAEIEAEKITA